MRVGIKPKFGNGSGPAIFGERAIAPGGTTIGGHQKEGVMGQRVLRFADDPTVFQIVKLGLAEARHTDAGSRFSPREAAIVTAEQDGGDGAGGSVDITCEVDFAAYGRDGREFQKDGAGFLFGTEETDRLEFFFSTKIGNFDGLAGIFQDNWLVCGRGSKRRQSAGEQKELRAEKSQTGQP